MKKEYELLTDALRCALHNERVQWESVDGETLSSLILLSRMHHVLPMLAEAIYCSPAVQRHNRLHEQLISDARRLTALQARRTADFLLVCDELRSRGLYPVITKGIMCRRLYPHPDQRSSIDEDMLVDKDQAYAYHTALIELGFEPTEADPQVGEAFEISYINKQTDICIEVHTCFFSPDSVAYGDCNAPLKGAEKRSCEENVFGVRMRTFDPTDHLLYLILHAYKHFLHGGFGIRQAADICMFNSMRSNEIDRAHIMEECEKLRLCRFASAIFEIGEKYLDLPREDLFCDINVDPEPLLDDMLTGGLYGTEDVNRAHSSTMTLEAVASHKEGRRSRGALHSVFLPKRDLEGRYPYLKKHGWLLPIAWIERGAGYLKSRKASSVSPSESLRIGRERVELLKKYGIID